MYVFNLITFTKLCSLLAIFFNTQQIFQRCLKIVVRVIWRRDVGKCRINVEIYKVEQRWVNVAYFNVDINNVRQRRNNVVILSVEFHNVDQHWNNVLNMTFFKKLKIAKKYFWASKKKRWLIWLIILAVDCDRLKRKWNMERTMRKCWKV